METITPATDLARFVGVHVEVVRDGAAVGGEPGAYAFTGAFVSLAHYPSMPGGTFDVDPGMGRTGGRTAFAVPYGSTITIL